MLPLVSPPSKSSRKYSIFFEKCPRRYESKNTGVRLFCLPPVFDFNNHLF
jgi:hypothetical protein